MSGPEHTAAFKIFHYPYYCRVRGIHLVSETQLEIFGIVSSGNNSIDRAVAMEFIDCQLTIEQMAELFADGVSIQLSEPEKSVAIYEILKQHLEDHLNNVTYAVNMTKSPVEDLRKLEALAAEIYKIARMYRQVDDLSKTGVLGKLGGLGRARPMSRPMAPTKEADEPQKLADDMHAPVAQAIARQFYKRSN